MISLSGSLLIRMDGRKNSARKPFIPKYDDGIVPSAYSDFIRTGKKEMCKLNILYCRTKSLE